VLLIGLFFVTFIVVTAITTSAVPPAGLINNEETLTVVR
jgi:hypothetical protein